MTKEKLQNREVQVAPGAWVKANYVKEETRPARSHLDGSVSAAFTYLMFGPNKTTWYQYYDEHLTPSRLPVTAGR